MGGGFPYAREAPVSSRSRLTFKFRSCRGLRRVNAKSGRKNLQENSVSSFLNSDSGCSSTYVCRAIFFFLSSFRHVKPRESWLCEYANTPRYTSENILFLNPGEIILIARYCMFYTCNICERIRSEEFKFSIVSPSLRILGNLACTLKNTKEPTKFQGRGGPVARFVRAGKRNRAEIFRNPTFLRHWTRNNRTYTTSFAAVNIVGNTVPDDTSQLPRRARISSKRGRPPPSIDRLVKCSRATVPSSRYGTCPFGQKT